MYHLLIKGASYRGLDFDGREKVRDDLRRRLGARGIRFVEYPWVWNENDQCLLLAGSYDAVEDARWWIKALECAGFETCIQTTIPGEPPATSNGAFMSHRPCRLT